MKVLRPLTVALLIPAALAAQSTDVVETAAASITEDDVIHRIGVIAHDSMLGRDTPSPGLNMTAEYIAREFQRFGLQPGGDEGTFIQRYAIRQLALDVARSEIRISGGATLRIGEDFVSRGGVASEPITGIPVVIDGRSGSLDAVEAIAPRSILILVVSTGPGTRQLFGAVQRLNPAALILAGQPHNDDSWNRMVARQGSPQRQVGGAAEGFAFLEIRDLVLEPLLDDHGYDLTAVLADTERAFTVTRLDGLEMTIDLQYDEIAAQTAPNTVGILEGSDPELKHEYLVFSGHMDHVGVGRAVDGDSIYNGADDDASGTIAVVELAEAFSKLHPRPRRSMIFVTV
ncbi:MAG: M28 family peptidase, partial [Gemmatimonadales bacterium]